MLRFSENVTKKFSQNVTTDKHSLYNEYKEVFSIEKQEVLDMLSKKLNGEIHLSFDRLAILTGYSKRQLIRLSKSIQEKGIDSTLVHGNIGLVAHNRASIIELDYIKEFKKQYPKITIAQFRDIYLEDIIFNPDKSYDVKQYNLQPRSLAFFQRMFKENGWVSPVKHKSHRRDGPLHLIRNRCPRAGMLVQIDGTPYDWFNDGRIYTLHLAVDDATSDVLAGWFTPNECQFGYCKMMYLLIKKKGIPMSLYSDKHTIFKSPEDNITQFGMMMEELGVELIFANSPQAKGRIERYNGTAQNRLPNDIIRFKIKDYDELNAWFNSYYIKYINQKFAHHPFDPNYEFVEIDDSFDLNSIFTRKDERVMLNGNMFSYNGYYYVPHDENGEVIKIRKTTKVKILDYVLETKICIKYFGKIYECSVVGKSERRNQPVINNQKELIDHLNKKR